MSLICGGRSERRMRGESSRCGGEVRKGFRQWSDAKGVAHRRMVCGGVQFGEFRAIKCAACAVYHWKEKMSIASVLPAKIPVEHFASHLLATIMFPPLFCRAQFPCRQCCAVVISIQFPDPYPASCKTYKYVNLPRRSAASTSLVLRFRSSSYSLRRN